MGTRRYRQDPKTGQMRGAVGGPGATAPTATPTRPAAATPTDTTAHNGADVTATYATYKRIAQPQTTDAPAPTAVTNTATPKGTDAPPLAIAVKGGARLYVPNPADAEWAAENPDDALAQGKAVPSVTTCMGTLNKPALLPWASKMASLDGEAKLQQIADTLETGDVDTARGQLDTWLTRDRRTGRTQAAAEMAGAYRRNRDSAAVRGTDVHAIVESLARGDNPDVPEEYAGYVQAYQKFRSDFPEMQYVAEEVMLLNKEHGYAGTADVIAKIGDKYYVVDYKTSATGAVYDSVGLQLAALAKADTVMHPDGSQSPAPHISGGIGIGLSPDGKYTATPFRTDDYFDAFVGSAKVWRSNYGRRNQKLTKASGITDILDNT